MRSRVHEYGGGDWCLADRLICYVRAEDQQIYTLDPDSGESKALTQLPAGRFNALTYDPAHNALIAVCETHADDEVTNTLVMISLTSRAITTLHRGHDFYTMPATARDGQKLAFIAWDHPFQPWVQNRLVLCERADNGTLGATCSLGAEESFVQPGFDDHDELRVVTDRSGWWNLHRYDEASEEWINEAPVQMDCAFAQWQCGPAVWDQTASGALALCAMSDGEGTLLLRTSDSAPRELSDKRFCLYREIRCFDEWIYCVAYSRTHSPSIIRANSSGELQTLYRASQPNIGPISVAEGFTFPVDDSQAHGYFYPPTNTTGPAPLVIFTHGGPTAACYPNFNPKIQYWTQRGFAIADINYRGSTGFGREYRLALQSRWGESDVADCVAAADFLADAGLCHSNEVFIRGSSAGGYTTLCALAFSDRFRGGASLYGVSDPLALIAATHKFESHYLQWLIGDPEVDSARYAARTPLHHAGQIKTPAIFFQGTEDPVVVPKQTADMVSALETNGVSVRCRYFEGEAHGFRQARNAAQALEEELLFYRDILNDAIQNSAS